MNKLSIGFVVEAGKLEHMALVLAESIRTFAGSVRDCPVYAVHPAHKPLPGIDTITALTKLNVIFISHDLNHSFRGDHPGDRIANKTFASAFLEEHLEGASTTLLFLDTDTLVLNDLHELILDEKADCAVKPVDVKNIGILWGDEPDYFWRAIYDMADTTGRRRAFKVETTVDNRPISSYFNSGVIAVDPQKNILRYWAARTEEMARRSDFFSGLTPAQLFHRNQALFAACLTARIDEERIDILPARFNYPFHLHSQIQLSNRIEQLDLINILHYHDHFEKDAWRNDISISVDLTEWIITHVLRR
jgi:lipopolysaccharide biosynthesis glycosyltransferase